MKHFLNQNKPYVIASLFILVFVISLINNMPTWILGKVVEHYSQGKLKLYNQNGNFWHGSGLLVATDTKLQQSAPLLLVDWNINLGLTKFIDVKFTTGNNPIAEVYLNKAGVNLDKVNLSLSISQVSQLSSIVQTLGLSGNISLITDHIILGKTTSGIFDILLSNVSSSISPVNPLGSYKIQLNASNSSLNVASVGSSLLMLKGNGNLNSLSLDARIDPAKKEQMAQFITVMGIPKADGSYELKIF
jgi:hypothetical protein